MVAVLHNRNVQELWVSIISQILEGLVNVPVWEQIHLNIDIPADVAYMRHAHCQALMPSFRFVAYV